MNLCLLLLSIFPSLCLFVSSCEMSESIVFVPVCVHLSAYFSLTFPLREKCPYSEFFWSVFSRIRTEYGEILGNAGKYGPEKLRIRTLFTFTEKSDCDITFNLKIELALSVTSIITVKVKLLQMIWGYVTSFVVRQSVHLFFCIFGR